MNDIGLTHIESLDSETVNVPGLDVDEALEKTITLGKTKLRNRRIFKAISGFSVVGVLVFIFLGASLLFGSTDQSVRNDVIKTAQTQFSKIDTKETPEVIEEQPVIQQSTTPTNPAPVIEPKLVSIRSFGNSSLCNITAPSDPGPGGVVIGPSTNVQIWEPSTGETRVENVAVSSRQLTIKNVAHNNGVRGAFVDLISGFDSAASYANITTLGFTYCESGYKLEITPRNNASGYTITTTSL